MKTDDLIALMAADARPAPPLAPQVAASIAGVAGIVGGLFLWATGLRPELAAALTDPVVLMKWLLPLALVAVALPLTLRLTRPEVRLGRRGWLFAPIAGIAAGLFLLTLIDTPPAQRLAELQGQTLVECLVSISTIALPPLLLALAVLRRGATTAPLLTGTLAGLACGAVAAALYALHCPEDNPLFFVTWYGTGILIAGAVGALAGSRLLRW